MKAIVQDEYGSPQEVLGLREVDRPSAEGDQVLVRVGAASVNPYDWHYTRGVPYVMRPQSGLRRPKHRILGADVAGTVEAVGPDVSSLLPGDEVFAFVGSGCFAEYVAASEAVVAPKPDNLSFEQAAAVPLAGQTALQFLRDHAPVSAGRSVLIVGASGGVGTFAVQLAKHYGAEVTGVCSTQNLDLVRSLGAEHVIDYTQEDFTRAGKRYDVIVQLAGTVSPGRCRRVLAPEGTLIVSSGDSEGRWIGPVDRVLKARLLSPFVGQTMIAPLCKENAADLRALKELIEQDALAPVVSGTRQLGEAPEAVAGVEEGHTRGKVVLTL